MTIDRQHHDDDDAAAATGGDYLRIVLVYTLGLGNKSRDLFPPYRWYCKLWLVDEIGKHMRKSLKSIDKSCEK
jgi:hypothetical protein